MNNQKVSDECSSGVVRWCMHEDQAIIMWQSQVEN